MDEILAYLIILALAGAMHAQSLPNSPGSTGTAWLPGQAPGVQPFELTAMRLSTDLTP